MKPLGQNDDLLKRRESLHAAEGDAAERMQQIAREAYATTQSNLYSINPDKSHVSKEFAAGDPEFWTPKPQVTAKRGKKRSGNSGVETPNQRK